jgi:hypothetical protein
VRFCRFQPAQQAHKSIPESEIMEGRKMKAEADDGQRWKHEKRTDERPK